MKRKRVVNEEELKQENEWYSMKKKSDFTKKDYSVAFQNLDKNRYADILALNHSRVILKRYPIKEFSIIINRIYCYLYYSI
jgi:protein tyrosine phosphatase